MSTHLHFSFDDADGARRAVRALEKAGVSSRDIEVMSGEPFMEVDDPLSARHPTHIGLFSLAGGLIGCLAGFLLVYLTSRSYPLVTSSMPLVPPMTTGVIVYETTAIGAILFAFGRMLWEMKLPDYRHFHEDYDSKIDEGALLVSVAGGGDEDGLKTMMEEIGGSELKT